MTADVCCVLKINRKISEWLLFCVRMMSPVPCALSTMMLCLLKLMKHRVIWSLLFYWKHSTWLGKLHFQKIRWDGKCIVFRVNSKLTFRVVQCHIPDIFSRLSQMPLAVVVHIFYGDASVVACNMVTGNGYKNNLGTACYVILLNFFLLTTSLYTFLSVCGCVCIQKTSFLGT